MSTPIRPESAVAVDSDAALATVAVALERASLYAVDTEFMRVDTYYPQLCLLQIATPDMIYCIDPLAVSDLRALDSWLHDPQKPKVMHAARQDLEVLALEGKRVPHPVIDTQVAAALLGLSDQISYAALVERYCGVVIDKSQTRTDWSQRPLTAEQTRYAALDVSFLLPAWAAMEQELANQGKLDWLTEECNRLVALRDENGPPWARLKGLTQLDGRALSVAKSLAEWREGVAQASNRPRTWILRDESLFAMARRLPCKLSELTDVPGLGAATVRRHGEQLLSLINEDGLAAAHLSRPDRPLRLTPAGTRLLGEFQQLVRQRAEDAAVAPGLLAARRDLEQLIMGQESPRLAQGWRATVIGSELAALCAAHVTSDLCISV